MSKREWNDAVTDRVERLLSEMGWDATMLAKAIYKDIGATGYKTVIRYFEEDRRSIPSFSLSVIAEFLGIDIRYLMLKDDDLARAADPTGRYAMASRVRQLEQRSA